MTSRQTRISFTLLAATFAAVSLPSNAWAKECSADSDCEHGFSCEVTAVGGCPGIACAPDGDCPPVPPCDPSEIRECVPARDCAVDGDCAPGMVCHEHTEGVCWSDSAEMEDVPTPVCPEGAACPIAPAPPENCTETTVTQCTPRSALPCSADADCGEGFSCEEIIEQWCNGGSATGDPEPSPEPASGGAADPGTPAPPPNDALPLLPPEGECGSTPTGMFHCVPKEISCEYNSDCPESWLCKPVDSGDAVCSETFTPDGMPAESVCDLVAPPTDPEKMCAPPYDDYGYSAEAPRAGGGGSTGSDDPEASTPSPDTATGGRSGNTSDPNQSNNSRNPARPNDNAADPGPGVDTDGATSGSEDDGCQISHGRKTSTTALLVAMAGLFGVARRRRRSTTAS